MILPPLLARFGADAARVAGAAVLAAVSFGVAGGPAAGLAGLVALGLAATAWNRAPDPRAAFLRTWLAFGTAHLAAFSWVIGHPDPGPAVAGVLAIVLIPMLVVASWAVAFRLFAGRSVPARAVGLTGVSALAEFVLHEGPLPLPWGLPSHLAASFTPLDGLAATAGAWAPAAFVLALAVVLDQGTRRSRVAAVACAAAALFLRPGLPIGPEAHVALVQPGLAPADWERDGIRTRTLASLTDSLLGASAVRPDWVVWPETALRSDAELAWAEDFAGRRAITVVSGTLEPDPDGRRRNSVRVFGDGSGQVVTKRRLVPWVEWIPLEGLARALSPDAGPPSSYRAGSGDALLEVDGTAVGAVVCFESLFPEPASRAARAGARLLVVVTNDAWWGTEAPARAHLAFSRRRAVETGLPVLQAAVSGFTGVIEPDGRVRPAASWMQRRAATLPVVLPQEPRAGGLPALPGALLLVAAGLLPFRRNSARGPRVHAAP